MTPIRALLVEFAKLDLGSKPESYPCAPCGPCEKPRRYFPTVYISDQDNPVDIPDEGTATIEYKVRGRSMNERDGKKRHSADIEIQTIDSGKNETKKKEPKEGGGAILLKTPVAVAMEDLRAITELARGDMILRKIEQMPAKVRDPIMAGYDRFKPILQRDLQAYKTQFKKHIWPTGGLFRKKEVDRMAGSGLRRDRDNLAHAFRKERSQARIAAAAQSDIKRAKKKIGFAVRELVSELIELDSRPRNNNGQFVGAETGGADPDSMHAAYGPGTVAKAAGLGAVAGGAVVGGLQVNKARKALSKLASRA